ncbi:hypothetical protein J5N97_003803 [Dioscorea zingiberensis]|uniref:DUF641 domain-containing protein n=1 Tax=Dioscorea zingiberensis TaxID=325984 RepID=A0A9D5D6M4_9LILI|nr:hypothetical protein J5N97_003803 [Dioscorea zingiberensis]
MDTGSTRASKSSGMFLRISKLCKLRSVGVFSSTETRKPSHHESSSAVEEKKCDDSKEWKVHPRPLEETLEEFVISKLFSTISALKSAYVQLQQGHIPYEPRKLKAADELVVSELESLSELEHLYISKQKSKSLDVLVLEIQKHQEVLEELQSQIQARDAEILGLKWEIEELDCRNAEMKERVENVVCCMYRELSPSVFSDVFELAYKSIHDFTKPVISFMKASGWDLTRAASSIVGSVFFAEKSHKKYAFEAYICRPLLSGEDVQCLELDNLNRVMSFQDPFDALMEDPDSSYGKFCRSKYLQVIQPKLEGSFFSNLDQRRFVLNGGHPRTPFYQAFAKMARLVWCLRVMTCSFIPNAEVFYVNKGENYSEDFMESIVNSKINNGEERLEVGFTVIPGYKIGVNVIRCKVYLCRMTSSNDAH